MLCQNCQKDVPEIVTTVDGYGRAARYCLNCASNPTSYLQVPCFRCKKLTYNKTPWTDGNCYCFDCRNEVANETWAKTHARPLIRTAELITSIRCRKCALLTDESKGSYTSSGGFICFACQSLKVEDRSNMETNCYHIRLNLRGTSENIAFFHWLLARLDPDWPGETDGRHLCQKCGGATYPRPRFDPEKLRGLGKICGLRKVKVKYWGKSDKCHAKIITLPTQDQLDEMTLLGMVN